MITGRPTWSSNDNVTVEYECYLSTNNSIAILLKISWPEVSNIDDMDFNFYQLSIEVFDEQENNYSLINSCTVKTDATSYKYIFEVPETSNNNNIMMAQVQIDATNRCNDTSDMHLSNCSDIDKGMPIPSCVHVVIQFITCAY